jgi:hypothetical protein
MNTNPMAIKEGLLLAYFMRVWKTVG